MTEETPSQIEERERRAGLEMILRMGSWIAPGFFLLSGALALLFQSREFGIWWGINIWVNLVCVQLPRWQLRRGQVNLAVQSLAAGVMVVAPLAALLIPSFFVGLALMPLLGIFVALAFGSGKYTDQATSRLLLLGGACGLFNQGLLFFGWAPAGNIERVTLLFNTLAIAAIVFLIFLSMGVLLRRLQHRIASEQATNLALKQAQDELKKAHQTREEELERLVNERTKALVESEQGYRLLAEMAPVYLWAASAEGRLTFLDEAAEHQLGRSLEQVASSNWAVIVHRDDRAGMWEAWKRSLATGLPLESEARLRDGSGVFRWFLIRAKAVSNDAGQVLRWFGSAADVDELHHAREQAEAATRVKSTFLATMSHEIRTPLHAILGATDLLGSAFSEEERRSFGEIIRSSGEHLLTLINGILDYSKIEAGKIELEQKPFCLHECAEGALEVIAGSALKLDVDVFYLPEEGLPEVLLGDVGRLRQVLVNLLSNALKFSPPGADIELRVELAAPVSGTLPLKFSVLDQGPGIPDALMPQLFQPFTQGDSLGARGSSGTGLGLSICKRLTEGMHGELRAENRPSGGACFELTLSVPFVGDRPSLFSSVAEFQGGRALLLCRKAGAAHQLSRWLEAWGLSVTQAKTTQEATDALGVGVWSVLIVADHQEEFPAFHLPPGLRAFWIGPGAPPLFRALAKPLRPRNLLAVLHRDADGGTSAPLCSPSPGSILLVEDNPTNQRILRLMLRRLGYEAAVVEDGVYACEAFENRSFDLVFMDVQMPRMDGLEATRTLRQRPLEPRPFVVGMSANASHEDRLAGLRAGMDDYLAKPASSEPIDAILRKYLERKTSSDARHC